MSCPRDLSAKEVFGENLVNLKILHLIQHVLIGVLFCCFGRNINGPGLPGGSIIYQGHLFSLKGTVRFLPFQLRSLRLAPTRSEGLLLGLRGRFWRPGDHLGRPGHRGQQRPGGGAAARRAEAAGHGRDGVSGARAARAAPENCGSSAWNKLE